MTGIRAITRAGALPFEVVDAARSEVGAARRARPLQLWHCGRGRNAFGAGRPEQRPAPRCSRACLWVLDGARRSHPLSDLNTGTAPVQAEVAAAAEKGESLVTVSQDVRLDNRVVDLRTPANQAIFRIQSAVSQVRGRSGSMGCRKPCDGCVPWRCA